MPERVMVYDLDRVYVPDPEGAIDYATGLNWNSAWPKGYMEMSFTCKRRDIFASWAIKESYGVIVRDGATIVYQGRIETIAKDRSGANERVTVHCVGWWVLFEEREIYKWWIDIKAISHCHWPEGLTTDPIQTTFFSNNRDNIIQCSAATGDHSRAAREKYRELYELPAGYVRRISFDYVIRSGENLILAVTNVDNYPAGGIGFWEWYVVGGKYPSSATGVSVMFTKGNTRSMELWVYLQKSDVYDQNDYAHTSNLRVEATYEPGHRTSTPTYTQGQLVEDVILLVNQQGEQLSTDFSRLGDPGLILDPFAMEKRAYAGSVVEKIAGYGDANLNTWGVSVWDESGTSDGLPRVVFNYRSTDDWEYELELSQRELAALTYERVSDRLHNDVAVVFTDNRGETIIRTSADNADYMDSRSVSREYRRGYTIELGDGDETRADYIAKRFLQYHKERVTRGSVSVKSRIRTKGGGYRPTNRVQAGQRFKLLNTNEVFFIRYTSYDAETETVRISPDLPEDNLAMLFVQRERKLGKLA